MQHFHSLNFRSPSLYLKRTENTKRGALTTSCSFTRYAFTPQLSCTSQSSFYCPLHLHCSHYCNTIARLRRNIQPPTRLPQSMPYTIQYWQGQYRVKANITVRSLSGEALLGSQFSAPIAVPTIRTIKTRKVYPVGAVSRLCAQLLWCDVYD